MRVCPHCQKNDFKHAGAYNLHVYHCEVKSLRKPKEQQQPPTQAAAAVEEKHTCNYRMLRPNVQAEFNAMLANYSEVCDVCQNVR